jgi:O-antigen ligase
MTTAVAETSMVSESRWIRSSRWLLMATAACLPLYVVRWRYGPLPTTLLETLILATVTLYVVGRWREGGRRPVSTAYDIPIVLLLLAAAISVLVAKDHRGALGLFRAYFVEPVAIFYVAVDLLRRRDDVKRLLLALAAGSSAFAVLNIIVFTRAFLAHAVNVGGAPNALYMDANYVAMYLEPPVALAAGLVLFAGAGRWRWIGIAWLALTGVALMLMFSKGTYLALCVLGVIIVVSVRRWRVPILAGLIVAAVVISRIPLVSDRLVNAYGSIMGREEIFKATMQMIRDSPIFGVGLGGYSYQFRGAIPEVYPHDIWLTFWVETGLLGVIAFAIILFGLLWRGWRSWPSSSGFEGAVLWGVLGALTMWTVHGFVDSPYWKNDMSAEFWVLAALEVVAMGAIVRTRSIQRPGSHP